MNIPKIIKNRQSIRSYKKKPVSKKLAMKIIRAGAMAPSGKNGQPWRFALIDDPKYIKLISELSIYKSWMQTAPCMIAVFLDKGSSYHYVKDVQSIGACIQNMLLTACSFKLGACWIGEIYKDGGRIKELLGIQEEDLEFMAALTVGYSLKKEKRPAKLPLNDLLLPKEKP